LKIRPILWQLGFWTNFITVSWLALTPSPPRPIAEISDIVLHALAFLVLTFLLAMAHFPRRLLWPALLMFFYGAGLEMLQGFMGARFAEWKDLGVDLVGISMGLLLLHFQGDAVDRLLQTVLQALRLER